MSDFDYATATLTERLARPVAEQLEYHGYKPITEFNGVTVGARVHNDGEQFTRAHQEGTGTVTGIFEKSPSSWSQSYGSRDIEVAVQHDDGRERQWASYRTRLVSQETIDFHRRIRNGEY
jgi:hypothetical protein